MKNTPRNSLKNLFVILLTSMLIVSCNRDKPTGDLTGGVHFKNTLIPIEGVLVEINDKNDQSEGDGTYMIKGIQEGQNQLTAKKSGYENYDYLVNINEGPNKHNIEMSSTQFTGRVFGQILGERTRNPKVDFEVILLNPDETDSKLRSSSDIDGNFDLTGVPRGSRILVIKDGDSVIIEEEFVLENSELEINFNLHEPLIDPRDGREYPYLIIGDQVWMGENMSYVLNDGNGSWCYNDDPANCAQYGRMYNWQTAVSACPDGWHLPSDEEWKMVEKSLGMSDIDAERGGWRSSGNVGYKMKSRTGWDNNGNGDNSSGLDIRPGAGRRDDGLFDLLGLNAGYWSSTESDEENAWGRGFSFDRDGVFRLYSYKTISISVRCVQD